MRSPQQERPPHIAGSNPFLLGPIPKVDNFVHPNQAVGPLCRSPTKSWNSPRRLPTNCPSGGSNLEHLNKYLIGNTASSTKKRSIKLNNPGQVIKALKKQQENMKKYQIVKKILAGNLPGANALARKEINQAKKRTKTCR